MIIKEIAVKNFRPIQDESLTCENLTALVGRNGAGKSSFLRALDMFYDAGATIRDGDFYNEDTTQDIEIAVTFCDLTEEEKDFFHDYIDKETLTVVRVFSLMPSRKSGTYHGMRLQNPDFKDVRFAGGKREITSKYNELKEKEEYSILPNVRSADQALEELQKWETANPFKCVRMRDDGQFFGFTGVGKGYLGNRTRFIPIPAVRDASDDATEGRGSSVTQIMDLVVRGVLAQREDITTFKEETQEKYQNVLNPSKLTELNDLQAQLSTTLKQYAPDADIHLDFENPQIIIPMPEARVKLLEDGYESSVQRTGHGLQRAFIFTMLQHLVAIKDIGKAKERDLSSEEEVHKYEKSQIPNYILGIEEPEIYQHPSRQRHLASVLYKLSTGTIPGVVLRTQVIYTTHSPLFVGLDRFDQIRVLRKKVSEENKPKVTVVTSAVLDKVADALWKLDGRKVEKYTSETLRPRMQAIMTPWMSEGFFADVVALVEGEGDRAALLTVADSMGYDMESMGICVVPCMGKNNLDRPAIVFRDLGIRTYLIWDNDKDAKQPNPDENKRLLRLIGVQEEDWPVGVWEQHACLDCNLECTLQNEITPAVFDPLFEEIRTEFRMKKDRACKNPIILRLVIQKAAQLGHTSRTLMEIVERIVKLRNLT